MEYFDEEERKRNLYREGGARAAVCLLRGVPAAIVGWLGLAALLETFLGHWWWTGLIGLFVVGIFVWGWLERRKIV